MENPTTGLSQSVEWCVCFITTQTQWTNLVGHPERKLYPDGLESNNTEDESTVTPKGSTPFPCVLGYCPDVLCLFVYRPGPGPVDTCVHNSSKIITF